MPSKPCKRGLGGKIVRGKGRGEGEVEGKWGHGQVLW